VWCDYVDPEKRQNPEYKRFAIVAYSPTDEDGSTLLSTDSFHLVIERIAQYEASMSIPPLELAKAFCAQLLKSLPNPFDNLAEINHRNAVFEADGDHSTCATHDFCDANQVMLDAIESICGVADYHFAQNEMINAAWDIARKARFDADKCCEPVEFKRVDTTDFITRLHHNGYAVCIFTPEELNGADRKLVEDAMCQRGWSAIEDLGPLE
ncbi:MAG: hypothetical protein EBW87_06330, partial [Burkholderiaceae bacterium]|nr:hypothetical protein [Burkholderiaceae bacterium]